MKTITIDILNTKVIKLLEDLELLHLIRLPKEKSANTISGNELIKIKGAMAKEELNELDKKLNELRNEWR